MLRYAIGNRHAFAGDYPQQRTGLLRQARLLADEGVDYFQLREKDLPAQELVSLASDMRRAIEHSGTGMQIVLNAPQPLAAQAAVAWHTNMNGLLHAAHDAPPPVSISCHTLDDVAAAHTRAALLLFGPVFEKRVHGHVVQAGCGLDHLHRVVLAAAPTPVLALGGVTAHNAAACMQAGAAGTAAIRMFLRP